MIERRGRKGMGRKEGRRKERGRREHIIIIHREKDSEYIAIES